MFQSTQLLAIRWTWWQDPEKFQGLRYIKPQTFLGWERDSECESSCEMEYFGGEWWCGPDSFGLVLDPNTPIRRVWASDVHTVVNDKGQLAADDRPHSAHTAVGWEGAYRKFPKWRRYEKTWWAEGTFPAHPNIVASAIMENASKDALRMYECSKDVFGNLPMITMAGHPNAVEKDQTGIWRTFDPTCNRHLGVRL